MGVVPKAIFRQAQSTRSAIVCFVSLTLLAFAWRWILRSSIPREFGSSPSSLMQILVQRADELAKHLYTRNGRTDNVTTLKAKNQYKGVLSVDENKTSNLNRRASSWLPHLRDHARSFPLYPSLQSQRLLRKRSTQEDITMSIPEDHLPVEGLA
jgi:hypothetical protein